MMVFNMARETIVIATQGPGGLDDLVSPVFARASTFTIVEAINGEIKNVRVEQNPAVMAPSGAGIQVAQLVAGFGANVVIAGGVGPNAHQALASLGIRIISGISGVPVRKVLDDYFSGRLSSTMPGPMPPLPSTPRQPSAPYPPVSYPPIAPPLPPQVQTPYTFGFPSKDFELKMLESMKRFLEEQLKLINDRIKELKESSKKE